MKKTSIIFILVTCGSANIVDILGYIIYIWFLFIILNVLNNLKLQLGLTFVL
jgi:hypothetical protein